MITSQKEQEIFLANFHRFLLEYEKEQEDPRNKLKREGVDIVIQDSVYLREAFAKALEALQSGYDGKPRRKPVRLYRLWKAFQGNENTDVSLENIANVFPTKNPKQDTVTAISWLNKLFAKLDFNIFIERITYYRINISPHN